MISRDILNRRPHIEFIAPRSGVTLPDVPQETAAPTPKEERLNSLIKGLEQVAITAAAVEDVIAERAKNEVLKLDIRNPEDAVVAQAAARCFPEKAIEKDGFKYVPEITFAMYRHCIKDIKELGVRSGTKNQTKSDNFQADKTDFGGQGKDKRPEINRASIPFLPVDIPAFIAAGIPVMFGMLFPLISANNKKDIIGHTHAVVVPSAPLPVPSGPGIPVLP
jgi:hypothetical protein